MGSEWRKYLEQEESKQEERIFDLFSPASEMASLVEGIAWKDISRVLTNKLIQVRDMLENLGADGEIPMSEISSALSYLQGQAFQLRFLQALPETLLEDLRNRDEKREKERKDEA